ncbi:MAG: hypothetical protein A3B37_00595 [Candidatus Sungbacteria bacterium RIFCSPLOWO2_01_FULL_59_16]|uniref:Uncharacterized protein n=1 Tax=Candidatus Sungbacteria bacterium RIFCSPLOWO2_01_FULL_59_16 TaxID=1802280 RepID=A0A1G2LBA4_9BACT|nr:MAG: hypothetical protein A3B37_00595 [Candidatus Sungbacteria bacterium RIFCSPLOWO2_01_FULL_59_16]
MWWLIVLVTAFILGPGFADADPPIVVGTGLFLPPAGDDLFPSTSANVEVDFGNNNVVMLPCSGPMMVRRGEPNLGTIDTEMLQLDLSCANGIMVRLNPTRPTVGQTQQNGDSFFDVFVEVAIPGMGTLANQNALRMQSKIGHIPPLGSEFFSAGPVPISVQDTTAIIRNVRHRVNGVPKPESSGEFSPVFSCFYECKLDKRQANWLEMTSLMLVNQSAKMPLVANILFVNGNEQVIARTATALSPLDLDEINVCATLDKANITVPPAGLIEVVLTVPGTVLPQGGAYGWVKNVVGKIPRAVIEPFEGKVEGIGKTQCRLVGPNVVRPFDLLVIEAPSVQPVYIERTGD